MTGPKHSPSDQELNEQLFGEADVADGTTFGYRDRAEFPPITLDVARDLLDDGVLVAPTQWWEHAAFVDETASRGDRWDAEVRFGGTKADYGEGPQAHIDTVYFVSDGEFSRETLKDMVATADMDAVEMTMEYVDGAEALRFYWDE